MKIIIISPQSGLYAAHFEGEDKDEYSQFLSKVTDLEYVTDHVTRHSSLLDSLFWHQHGFSSSDDGIFRCVNQVVDEAFDLMAFIRGIGSGQTGGFFKPLNGIYKNVWELVPSKAYGLRCPSFLRLYAIALNDGSYVIVDGGIKLADTIQNDPDLSTHVFKKIDSTKRFLIDNDIYLRDDI